MSIFNFVGQEEAITPQLVINRDQLVSNTRHAIEMAGSADRLWPHVKTHKSGDVISILIGMGITKFKCATIAEAEMTAVRGAGKVLLAYPAVGPTQDRLITLKAAFPRTEIIALFDDIGQLSRMDRLSREQGIRMEVMVDVDTGFNRTGVPYERLYDFSREVSHLGNIDLMGFHCYDGQRHERDYGERHAGTERTYHEVNTVRERLERDGIAIPYIIMGGTPSFPCYIEHEEVFLSPGTLFLNDHGYSERYPDLDFPPAAAVLARVVSTPKAGQFTLDLGCKGIASDPEGVRGAIAGFPHAEPLFQSEEHWVWRMMEGHEGECPEVGDEFFVIPTHICPTTALYPYIVVVSDGHQVGRWDVTARDRRITY